MYEHFKNIEYLYGDAGIRMPNTIFRDLSSAIKSKNGNTNIQQVAFAYAYLVTIAFLYKYAHFVDVDNMSYIQNGDIKELLGYNPRTKTIDKIIKKGGVLDELGLTLTTKDYPVRFASHPTEKVNGISIREITTINMLDANDINYNTIKSVVKNRNYEVKEPLFLTTEYTDSDYGTLYSIERTHKINIKEFLTMMFDEEFGNIDFLMYGYFKSRCKGYKDHMKQIAVYKITLDIGIDRGTFYNHLKVLKEKRYIEVIHKEWKMGGKKESDKMEANEYYWKGVN